jgi:hypothetical protein
MQLLHARTHALSLSSAGSAAGDAHSGGTASSAGVVGCASGLKCPLGLIGRGGAPARRIMSGRSGPADGGLRASFGFGGAAVETRVDQVAGSASRSSSSRARMADSNFFAKKCLLGRQAQTPRAGARRTCGRRR